MNITPVETAPLISEVAKQGALEAFMLLVIIALCGVSVYLYKDGRDYRDKQTEQNKETAAAVNSMAVVFSGMKDLLNVLISRKN